MGLDHLEGCEVAPFFVASTPLRPFPEFFKGAYDMDAQLFVHSYAADVGVESRDGHLRVESLRWDAIHDPSESADVVA